MAEAIIGPLVGRLHDLAIGEARALVAVNDDMQKLRDRLMWLQAFLRVADAKRRAVADEINKVWLHQTRDAVFDAEDALDHFYRQVDMSRYPWWARPSIACIATFTTQAPMRRVLSSKIKAINLRLEDIIQNKDKYKTEAQETDVYWKPSTTIQYSRRKLDDDIHQPNLPLHADEKQKLLEALVPTDQQELQKETHRPVVISVYGKSGVGKTTLVRSVYQEMARKNHFDVQAMESFAPNLTAANILHKMVQQLTEDNQNCPRSQVISMLSEKLKDKKYFLVIDGEVSITEWKSILTILTELKGSPNGNRILHITQHMPFEPSSHRHVHVQLKNLQEGDTIELFRRRLRHDAQEYEIYSYRDRICKITEGLPLSVVLLAGLVQSKEFLHEWDNVFNYLESKKSKKLDNILSLCFDDLPHELKGCFLYFTAFPTNITIEAHELVCMWMAEGFLRAMYGKTMEKVGEIYLDELIARNLANPVSMDDDSSAWSMLVSVQNKVHDFLVFEAHEANFLEVHGGDDSPTLTSARRLSLQNYTDKYTALARPLPKLRSIFSHFEQESKEEGEGMTKQEKKSINRKKKDVRSHMQGLLRGSEFLRVINLQGIEIGDKMPGEIDSVVHLEYLGITSCSLKKIPRSIRHLTSLQTLDVRETNVRRLPRGFWEIMGLRHVFGFALKLPKKLGSLKHLQTLDSIELDAVEQGLQETLGKMIHLENLFVWKIAADNMVSFSAALSKLEYLRNLALHGDSIPSSVFATVALRRVRYMLLDGELKSHNYSALDEEEDIDSYLPNLVILSLKGTKVSQDFISKLAKLPSLATLALYSGSYVDEELKFDSDGFHRLQKIKLDGHTLKTLTVKEGALNKLQELDILSELARPDIKAEGRIIQKIV